MIIKSAAWSLETFYKSEHPEYVAIRNIVKNNPQHEYILIGHGLNYEHFRYGRTLLYNLGSGNKLKYIFSYLMNFYLPLILKPSIIVGMGVINLIPMAIASVLIRARFISVITGDIWYTLSIIPIKIQKLFTILLKATFQRSYAILAISESVKKELMNNFHIRINKIIVYKYKISSIFNPRISKNLKASLNPSGPIVLTICRISTQKGLHYLIKASPYILKKAPNVMFIIRAYASEIKYERYLRTLIYKFDLQNNIKIMTEFTKYEEIPKYMGAADVFVLPSISEGLGVVILEAQACGVPVIASRVGGIPDIIKHEYNGLLVEPGDIKALAESILRVLMDKDLRRKLSKGALASIQLVKENELESLLTKFILSEQCKAISS